jgi:branched-chain amino acid transport system ATP-binding protein
MTGARLEVSGVCMRFAGVQVLDDVAFTVEPGTVHALIGPNGAGKSTLFNVLSGIYRPQAGSVRLNGDELIGLAPHRIVRHGVGRAFQNSSMFGGLTVEENLLLGRHRLTRSGVIAGGLRLPSARAEERASRSAVREVARFLGVERLLGTPAADLSYGDAKRVDVARALSTQPRLLLLDEPAAGTHTHEKLAMRAAIRRIAEELGTTVLLVEHDMGLVMGVSDVITVLNFGTVLATGAPGEIRTDPRVIEAYLGHSTARDDVMRAAEPERKSRV